LAQLALATGKTVAVLLMPPHDTSWQAASALLHTNWLWLSKPYNAEAMRGVLSRAAELIRAQQKPAHRVSPAVAAMPKPVITTTAAVTPELRSQQVQVVPQAASAVASAVEQDLTAEQLVQQLAQYPAGQRVLLRKLLAGLQARAPFEVRFTMQHFLIIHPLDDWVASNTPMPVLQRVAGSDALAASVTVRELALELVEDRLHQLGAVPHDLSDFLLQLVKPSLLTARSDAAH